jgi:small subunit ribosomal protein S4
LARYTDSLCRICRRESVKEGGKLFLKGARCLTEKCAVDRRPYPPGQHGQMRTKPTDYGIRLREKQKVKRMYGIQEGQFRLYFEMASAKKGVTGETLLSLLERRLDNAVYRMGFASSRQEARQLVAHGHFTVNGRRTGIPSVILKPGDEVVLKERSRKNKKIAELFSTVEQRGGMPKWLETDVKAWKGIVKALPTREDIGSIPINEQLIVELYSR